MQKDDIFWTHVKITHYGDRIVPYYFKRRSCSGTIYGIISRGKDECGFSEKDVFETVKKARTATGIDRVFCYGSSSHQHWGIVGKIHTEEGLVCPDCGPGTALIELDLKIFKQEMKYKGYTHFCFNDHKIGGKSRQYQVTLGIHKGCGSFITLKLKSSGCNCGAPIGDHVPGGSYCWKPLDKRKFL